MPLSSAKLYGFHTYTVDPSYAMRVIVVEHQNAWFGSHNYKVEETISFIRATKPGLAKSLVVSALSLQTANLHMHTESCSSLIDLGVYTCIKTDISLRENER